MLAYVSKEPGIGGTIKNRLEDFLVEEVMQDGAVLKLNKKVSKPSQPGDFTHFVLQKKGWNTVQALHELGVRLNCGPKRFGYAGTKDRRAITTQLCSAWQVSPEQLKALKLRDLQINGAWGAKRGVELGGLSGNLFTITVRGAKPRSSARVKAILKGLKGVFPNYFGDQRFGSGRANTHIIGKLIVRGDLESAAWNYLTYSEGEENPEARAARERLAKERDYVEAIEYFPQHLKYERSMLRHLAQFKNDYGGAIQSLPHGVSLMFVHAYQSQIFNELLNSRIVKGGTKAQKGDWICPAGDSGFPEVGNAKRAAKAGEKGFLCLPLIGYETEGLSEPEEAILRRESLTPKSFLLKSLPSLSARGGLRSAFAPLKKFGFSQKGGVATFKFLLQSGAYATSALREFLDAKAD